MMKAHELIKARREQMGWDEGQMATPAGLSISEYYDIEFHENELVTVVPLMNVRRLAEAIDVSIYDLFGLEDPNLEGWVDRRTIVIEARNSLGVTVREMGDGIGFKDMFVESLESVGDFLELYCYEVLEIVANYLKIPPQILLYMDVYKGFIK